MPPKVERKRKQDALLLEVQAPGLTQREIAKTIGISTRLFTKVKRNNKLYGDVEGIPQKRGPKPKLTQGMLDVWPFFNTYWVRKVLIGMVLFSPASYLSEYSREMEKQFGVKLSESRISQIFAENGINRKKESNVFKYYTNRSSQRKPRNAILSYGKHGFENWPTGRPLNLSFLTNLESRQKSVNQHMGMAAKVNLSLIQLKPIELRTSVSYQLLQLMVTSLVMYMKVE